MPDFGRMIDEFIYSVIVMIAGVHWSLQKAVIMAGYTIKLINQWLIENAFVPIIAQTNDSLRIAVSYMFIIALLVLGLTYMLAALVRLDVVSPRNALTWYAAGVLFFAIGPSFYQGMNDFRLNIAQVMYVSVLDGLNNNSGDFSSLSQVSTSDLDLGLLCDQFDVYLPGATGPGVIDGLDIAMAYLRGHAQDVMGYPQPVFSPGCGIYLQNPNPSTWAGAGGTSVVPMDWNMEGAYFDHNNSPVTWDDLTGDERTAAVSWAGASQQRALTAWPLLLFALIEQVVHLLITIAMGITFISFGIAILFAFFKRTESIANNIINQQMSIFLEGKARLVFENSPIRVIFSQRQGMNVFIEDAAFQHLNQQHRDIIAALPRFHFVLDIQFMVRPLGGDPRRAGTVLYHMKGAFVDMAKKDSIHPWQQIEEQAFHAFREWPLWLVLRERELANRLTQSSPDKASAPVAGRASGHPKGN